MVHLEFTFVVDDCVPISLDTHKGIIHVACIYRSTALTEDQNQLLLTELNKLPVDDNSELIIVGDFNLPDVNWHSGCIRAPSETADRNLLNQVKFIDFFIQKGLMQLAY